jgi:hydroxymethylbilane synthase
MAGGVVHTAVRVLSQDGTETIQVARDLPVERHVEAAQDLAAELAGQGAADLIAAARRETGAADDDAATAREGEE